MIDKKTQTIGCDDCGEKRSMKQLRSRNGKKLTLFKMPDGKHLCYECRKQWLEKEIEIDAT
jgi:hypothetical protein